MSRFFIVLSLLTVALFSSCQTQTQVPTSRDLGALEVRFGDDGVAKAQFTPDTLRLQATAVDESLLSFTSQTQATLVNSAQNDSRILIARFAIKNNTGSSINRLTLVAWKKPTNLFSSAINTITNFGGLPVTGSPASGQVASTTPTHAITSSSATPSVDSSNADMQLFSENETADLETLTSLSGQLLPFGFVARNNTNTAANRRVVNATNTNSDGMVTIALRVPRNNSDVYGFRMTFRVIAEPTTDPIYVQSPEEQTSGTFGGEAVSSLPSGASLRILPGGSQNLTAAAMINTRLTGSRSNPLSVMNPYFTPIDPYSAFVLFPEIVTPSGFRVFRSSGTEGALDTSTPNVGYMLHRPPNNQPFASNEPLTMTLKNVLDRDGFRLFPSTFGRGYMWEGVAPDQGSSCATCTFSGNTTINALSSLQINEAEVEFASVDNDPEPELIAFEGYSGGGGSSVRRLRVFDWNRSTNVLTQAFSTTINESFSVQRLLLGNLDNDSDIDILIVSTSAVLSSGIRIDTWLNTSTTSTVSFAKVGTNMPTNFSVTGVVNYRSHYRLADMNFDGLNDLVFASLNNIIIFENQGAGVFGTSNPNNPPSVWANISTINGDVSFADIDGDGDLDASKSSNSDVYQAIRFHTNNGVFSSASTETIRTFPDGEAPRSWLLDVNNDGYNDLIGTAPFSGTGSGISGPTQLDVYLNNGLGQFSNTPSSNVALPCILLYDAKEMIFADFNHDGKTDLLHQCRGNPANFAVLKNTGSSFSSNGTISRTGSNMRLTDWDGDGDTDVVTYAVTSSTGTNANGSLNLYVYLNN